jgi:hypothetical protein
MHLIGSGRTIGTRVYRNGRDFISGVEGLPDVVLAGPYAHERAKADADGAARKEYPHECGPATCGDRKVFAERPARETDPD